MARLGHWVVGVAALLLNGTACDLGHSCTEIGCASGVSVTLAQGSGAWSEGEYALEVMLDDEKAPCAFAVPGDVPAPGSSTDLDCGTGIMAQLVSRSSAANDFEVQLDAYSTPKTLTVELSHDGAEILSTSPPLHYTESQPNGPDCEPVCRNAQVELTVETP